LGTSRRGRPGRDGLSTWNETQKRKGKTLCGEKHRGKKDRNGHRLGNRKKKGLTSKKIVSEKTDITKRIKNTRLHTTTTTAPRRRGGIIEREK